MGAFGAGDRNNEASAQNSVTRVPGPFGMLCALSAISKECPVVCWSSNPTLPTLSSVLREQLDTCILGQIKTLSMGAEHSAFVQATSILVYVLAMCYRDHVGDLLHRPSTCRSCAQPFELSLALKGIFLPICYFLGNVLGTGNSAVNKNKKSPPLREKILVAETDDKQDE